MELQWLLVVQAYRINEDGTLDIAKIFQRMTIQGLPLKAQITVLAKVKFDPLKVDEETSFTFRMENIDSNDVLLDIELPYTFPGLQEWLRGASCYININLADVEFPGPGEHMVSIWHDDKLQASETFTIATE